MDEILQSSFDYISSWMPIELSEKEFLDILNRHEDLKKGVEEYGADTCEREMFMEIWAKENLGMTWPCYGDSIEVHDEFDKRLKNCPREQANVI